MTTIFSLDDLTNGVISGAVGSDGMLGGAGQGYTTNVAGTLGTVATGTGLNYHNASNWASTNAVFNGGSGHPVMTMPPGENTVQIEPGATLDVKGKVVINGIELEERLKTIETLLQIPTRDATMEHKHPKLKQLYEQYMHELEKYKTWNRLTGDTDAT